MDASGVDVERLEALAGRAAHGDAAARQELIEQMQPLWSEIVSKSRSLGRLASSNEHVQQVALLAIEKLNKANGHALRLYVSWRERNRDKTFLDWIQIVTKNVIRDYVRAQLGSPRKPE
jgi:hypothetical protein